MDLNFIADKVITQGVNVEVQGVDIEQVIHAVGVNELIEGLIRELGDKALIDAIIEQSDEGRN